MDRANQLAKSIIYAIERARNSSGAQPWRLQLEALVAEIRRDVLTALNGISIKSPSILPVERPDKLYRPIAVYSLKERVIASLAAGYLRSVFDSDFLESSYAFRAPVDGSAAKNHHDAFNRLARLRDKFDGTMWVAECDIQGFFDCVAHDTAQAAFEAAVKRAAARGIEVDSRARMIFSSFLNSYTFTGTAQAGAREWFSRSGKTGELKWPRPALAEFYRDPDKAKIGIPQGGAISCLVANLILHKADVAVESVVGPCDPHGVYIRYCDDMIIAHASEDTCRAAFSAYQKSLKQLKLPAHPPVRVTTYSAAFWKTKSRAPYQWSAKVRGIDCVPWVGFVGYQVRWDGLIRVRPDSIKKERRKLEDEARRIVELLWKQKLKNEGAARISAKQVVFRIQNRLLARSVGMHPTFVGPPDDLGFCWCGGFRGLANKTLVESQLHDLDRHRSRQIRWVRRVASTLLAGVPTSSRVRGTPRYFGYPWSYYAKFQRTTVSSSAGNCNSVAGTGSLVASESKPEEEGKSSC